MQVIAAEPEERSFSPPSISRSRLLLAAINIAKPVSLYLLLTVIMRIRPEIPAGVYIPPVLGIAALAWRRLPRESNYRVFVLYICGFGLFNALRTFADDVSFTPSYDYPISIDKAIFGAVPSVWLQDRVYEPGRISLLELFTTFIYFSYFSVHFLVLTALWAFDKGRLLRPYALVIMTTFGLGLIGYFLLPTAPPWLAAETGHLPAVDKIAWIATSEMWAEAHAQGTFIAGNNDVGAMPSVHLAVTAVLAMTWARIRGWAGLFGWLYVGVMGFSLVYLAEHYFIDLFAGLVTAVVAWKLCNARQSLPHSARSLSQKPGPLDPLPVREAL